MVFSSLIFLCVFMPIVFLVYYICPSFLKNTWLLISSLVFYAWGEPKYIFIMLFITLFSYFMGILIERSIGYKKKILLIVSVFVHIGVLGFFKYSGLFTNAIDIVLPIGISFYTFQTMSYVIDVYRDSVNAQYNIINFATYVSMFPQLIAGPIVRYRDVENDIDRRKLDTKNCAYGLQRFYIGLGKKVIFANQAGELWNQISAMQTDDMSVLLTWTGAVAYTFQIYFDFSGYSDMAIGMGQMLGFHFPENFNYPYKATSITEFWRRWHITLGTWFKEYIYIPLGGSRYGLARQIINIFVVWSLTGLWHGAAWNFVIWGLYFCILLIIEKSFLLKVLNKIPKIFSCAYTFILVAMGWVIFSLEDFEQIKAFFKAMFGMGVPFYDDTSVYTLYTHGVLFLLMALASAGITSGISKKIPFLIRALWAVLVLVISVAMIVAGSYNPFLYFRF